MIFILDGMGFACIIGKGDAMLIKSSKWEKIQKQDFQENYSPFEEAVDKGTTKGYDFNGFSQDLFSSLYQYLFQFLYQYQE